ncbi:acetoacetate decarboxylase family protein [Sulfitobacter sp. PR48]|uniref:acetoacetate decarboxylase family protein n=1 Tax=Sulfitobacter sp. PR48 TaxID=3028383 RepID=UPI00237AA7AA|nr:acetoacetate decarboxylase family protein [Sulfitobacter sp. PR48]MDD9722786.1 acetoacetate decarboxylase family protein [Sulfitobacter sp. PR48]
MLKGFTGPYTPKGRSSLVPSPPWHYAGRIVSIGARTEAEVAQRFLPSGFGGASGRIFGHFCEWQATTDGSELLDPAYSQYNEFFLLIEALSDQGEARLFCSFIFVDQDISMVRGHMQGFPKKLGAIRIGRSYGLDHPAAGRQGSGTRLGATVAVKDRRLIEAEWTGSTGNAEPIGFLGTPTFGLVGAPSIIGTPTSGDIRLVRQSLSARVVGPIHAAEGTLRLLDSPIDEIGDLAVLSCFAATTCEAALTVTGAEEAAF